MMIIRTILVEPKIEENIGAVARVVKNFGLTDLYLVNPTAIGTKAIAVASHADDVLARARIVNAVEEAIKDSAIVVGTTSRHGVSLNKHLRMPYLTPYDLKAKLKGKTGVLALLFGREDTGLLNKELMRCEFVVFIPTSTTYPVMNLSHAVSILLYELNAVAATQTGLELASVETKERLFTHVKTFLDEIGYKEQKKQKTMLMLRRILGRAELTAREVQTLRGILRKAEWKLKE
ncbi:MAG: RNA methyltransferase [Halobacteriota archaeon]